MLGLISGRLICWTGHIRWENFVEGEGEGKRQWGSTDTLSY